MLRDLLGEGALSSVVVSRLGALKNDPDRVKVLVRQLVGFWGLILAGLALLGMLVAPWLVSVIASGLEAGQGYDLAVSLTRIIFPYVGIIGLSAMTMGILHHLKVFGWSTSSSSFSNLFMIGWLLTGGMLYGRDVIALSKWIASGVVISGLVSWGSQLPGLRGSGMSLLPLFRFNDPEIKKIAMLLGPSILSVAAVQINVAVNHDFATTIGEGAASSLYFAFRLMQLPVGIVGVAVSTVLLPTLSDHLREGRLTQFGTELGRALVGASFLSIPAVAGLAILGPGIIAMLYERGAFDDGATASVWLALQGFLFGILPYVYNKSLIQGYFAKADMRTPVLISMFSIVINYQVNSRLAFEYGLGVWGLTLGTSTVLGCNTLMLMLGLRWIHGIRLPWLKMLKSFIPMAIFSLLMAAGVWKGNQYVSNGPMVTIGLTALGGAIYLCSWLTIKKYFSWDFRKI